jgi:hypothetical protein
MFTHGIILLMYDLYCIVSVAEYNAENSESHSLPVTTESGVGYVGGTRAGTNNMSTLNGHRKRMLGANTTTTLNQSVLAVDQTRQVFSRLGGLGNRFQHGITSFKSITISSLKKSQLTGCGSDCEKI